MRHFWLFLLGGMLAACGADAPASFDYEQGAALYETNFVTDEASPFDDAGVGTRTESGFRLGSETQRYVWAVGNDDGRDLVVSAETRLLTDTPNIGYGVGCRMAADGSGYYFLVSRDGYYAILNGTAQSVSNLTEWAFSEVISTGAGAQNTVRGVCAGESLALYVNDVLLAQAQSDTHTAGATGMIASGGAMGGSEVAFERIQADAASLP